jgi:DNA-binding response OmpR family regulator
MGDPVRLPRVLVLDDEPVARDLLRRYLKKRGYETVETGTIDSAMAALRAGPVDAMILDYRLGEDRNGLDVLLQFRREVPQSRTPAIMLTGALLSASEEAEITRNQGFVFHKPESLDTLADFLDRLLGHERPV